MIYYPEAVDAVDQAGQVRWRSWIAWLRAHRNRWQDADVLLVDVGWRRIPKPGIRQKPWG